MPALPQDTLSEYSFEEPADTQAVHKFTPPRTVAQALRLLPADATPEEQDSVVQKWIKVEPVKVTTAENDTIYAPGFKHVPGCNVGVCYDFSKNYFSSQTYFHPELRVQQIGMAAEPVTYRLSNDDYVTGVLLLSFFMVVSFIARNIHMIAEKLKNFFYSRQQDDELSGRANPEIRGQVFLVLETCLTIAILFFIYTQVNLTEVFNQVSPYILLGVDTAISIVYFVFKIVLYKFVNWVFFDRTQNKRWMDAYLLVVMMMGVSLFIVALLVVYFGLQFKTLVIVVALLISIFKIMLLVKCKQIIFTYKFPYVHLILYFCALEILPVLLLWKALVYFNEILVVNI